MKTIILTTLDSPIKAQILRGKLESEGIWCRINNEQITSLLPHITGIMGSGAQLLIEEKDLGIATKTLKLSSPTHTCPNCNSTSITPSLGKKPVKKIITILLSLIVGTPFGNIHRGYDCNNCKYTFED